MIIKQTIINLACNVISLKPAKEVTRERVKAFLQSNSKWLKRVDYYGEPAFPYNDEFIDQEIARWRKEQDNQKQEAVMEEP